MNTIQDLMNKRILKEIEDLREEQSKLQGTIIEFAEIVRDMSNKEHHEKDK